jgi:hypothetical protein
MACSEHLDRCVERTGRHADEMASRFERSGIVCDLRTSLRIASWTYTQTFGYQGLTWLRGDELVFVSPCHSPHAIAKSPSS